MKRLRQGLILVLVLAASPPAPARAQDGLAAFQPDRTVLGPGEVALPARRHADLLLVSATVNGRGPYTFVVDTGAGLTLVSRPLGQALPARGSVYTKEQDGSDRRLGKQVKIPELAVGDLVVAVGGAPVGSIDYSAWRDLLNREATVAVELLRGGTRTALTLAVSDLVRNAP